VSALADTSVSGDYLRGVEPARELLRSALEREEVVASSVLTRIELSIGMRAAERRGTDALVGALRWLPVERSPSRPMRSRGAMPAATRGSMRSIIAWPRQRS
jgi:predicted nucleic acid-binding protein